MVNVIYIQYLSSHTHFGIFQQLLFYPRHSNINKNIIDTAFIEIVRNIPYDTVNIFGKETIDYGVIGDYHGFIKCQNVMLETSATNEEKEEIASLLKGGIFI